MILMIPSIILLLYSDNFINNLCWFYPMKVDSSMIIPEKEYRIVNFGDQFKMYEIDLGLALMIWNDNKRIEVELASICYEDTDYRDDFFRTLDFAQTTGLEVVVAVDSLEVKSGSRCEKGLLRRLKPYNSIVQPGFQTYFRGKFNENDYILLLAQCSKSDEFNHFLECCLKILNRNARNSLRGKKTPNSSLNVPKLLKDIGEKVERIIEVNGLPEVIYGYKEKPNLLKSFVNTKYVTAIVQPNSSSFTYDSSMQNLALELTKDLSDDLDKSRAIFNWVRSNIKYDKTEKKSYRGALQVYNDREGVCGESAALQVTLERLVGNIAFLAEVDLYKREDHACAVHIGSDGKLVLIDTTYDLGFDCNLKSYRIISDEHSFARA